MKIWLPNEVEHRLGEAASTLRRLPKPKHGSPAAMQAAWPDIVRRTFHDAPKDLVMRAAVPPAAMITAMDEALRWLLWDVEIERKILWARACRVSWRRLEDADGRSFMTLRKVHREALLTIAGQLSQPKNATMAKIGFTKFINESTLRR